MPKLNDSLSPGLIEERSDDNRSDPAPAPDGDAIAIMAYLATDAGKKSGEKPSWELVQAIASTWPGQADRILSLAEDTLFTAPHISATVVDAVSDRIDPSDFVRRTSRHRVARCLFAYVRPSLLTPGQALELAEDEIDRLIDAVCKQ